MRDTSSTVDRPVFIVGSGRGGTTLLFQLLAGHPELASISNLTDRFPSLPQLAVFNRITALNKYKLFSPSIESIPAFEHCGLTEQDIPLSETDASPAITSCLHKLVSNHQKWSGKTRFINKNTSNTMRIPFLKAVFPDARFVYIIRNGYGVVNSLTRVNWWNDLHLWWLGQTPAQWEANGGDRYELAAIHWKKQVEISQQELGKLPGDQYIECRYEDMLSNPKHVIQEILQFIGLDWNDGYQKHFDSINVRSDNIEKWKQYLNRDARQAIYDASGDMLEKLGYGKA